MCEIRLTKLSCAAQQVGIERLKGCHVACDECASGEICSHQHVGYRSVIRAIASGASLKFGVQGASATN